MSETNEPVTDRIEAIRERYSAEDGWFYHDMAWLISEVDRLRAPEPDPWCREESCRHRNWRSGSMPTHRRGDDCPTPGGAS